MKNTLICTVYYDDSIKLAIKDYKINKVIFLKDKNPDKKDQQEAIDKLIEYNKGIVDFEEKEIPKYDIIEIVKKSVEIIRKQPKEDNIYLDITQGKRTQSIGLLFAGYKNHSRIKRILYAKEIEKNKYELITLPKLHFKDSDAKILKAIEEEMTPKQIIDKKIVSRGTFYNKVEELESHGFIEKLTDGKYVVTESGRIMALK